jgi:signal transduction histidine kinase/CheY-like chemotaxis protein
MSSIPRPVLIELLRLLMRNTSTSVLPCTLLAILLFFTLRNEHNQMALGIWAIVTIGIKLVSAKYSVLRLAQDLENKNPKRIITELSILNIIDAIAWGALTWAALDNTSVAGSIMIISVVAAIAGGSMSSLAPVWHIFLLFGVTMMLTVAAKLYLMHAPAYYALSVAAVLYIAALSGQAKNGHLAARNAIELRFENMALIDQLRTETTIANAAQEQAKSANHAKSQFLAAASHDLRQPIHAQKLFLEALAQSELTEWQRNSLSKAQLASKTMSTMLNTLLDASRIEAGTITPYISNFRLQPLLQKLENELSVDADSKQIVYRSRDSHHTLRSDPVLLEQILRNLIANAIRYTDKGGVLIGCRKCDAGIRIEVWDTGIGIAPDMQDKIFEEFFQVDNPERDRQKGFGLGLAITKGLAQTLRHNITVHSLPGKGSCFAITVPLAGTVLLDAPATMSTSVKRHEPLNLVALIIDDDDAVQEAMHTLLSLWGCTCLLADSLDTAKRIIQSTIPDIIISDYRLRAHQTGADAIIALRRQLGTNTPALLITGDTSPQRIKEAMATHMPLLHKPVSTEQLYDNLVALCPPQRETAA